VAVASDLEGTLTLGASWRALGAYVRSDGRPLVFGTTFARVLAGEARARLSGEPGVPLRERWMAVMLGRFRGEREEAFGEVARWVVDAELWPRRRLEVVAALRVHQAAGETLVLSSGAFQPIVEAFASRMMRETAAGPVIALGTPVEVAGGRLTGSFAGPLNVGEAKARRLHDTLGSERLYAAYGDSAADVPMLLTSDRPVAVYPDRALRRTATSLAWTVFEP